ncbi:site-specific integrase [Geothrix sp. PMB-07]|uniref:tyrosine-type recombinase/integrase n=1 Tax=Geothrix sp. PMB-07 TaxID=3068640 RepID=UPI0027426641|nr:site-specific integrase [Geothrix sp. PMB-07]WLT30299.1 site-specific integrase [Geothrix sp. PMB-07]
MSRHKNIYLRGSVYYYRFVVNEMLYHNSTHCKDIESAIQVYEQIYKETILGNVGIKKIPTFNFIKDKWLEKHCHYSDTHIRTAKIFYDKHICPVFGNKSLNRIDTEIISDLVNDFLKTHSKGSTNSLIKYINIVFNYAIELEYIKIKPYKIKRQKPDKKPKQLVHIDEIKSFIDFCYKNHKSKQTPLMITLGLLTGMREGEILGAEWSWFNELEQTLTVHKSKTGGFRKIFLDNYLFNKIKTYKAESANSLPTPILMFPARDKGQHPRSFITWALRKLSKKYGMTGKFSAHSLRHSYISNQHASGTALADIQEIVGHENLETTAGYIHANVKRQKEAQDRLSKLANLA